MMSTDANLLLELLEREFAYFLESKGAHQLLLVPRTLAFLERDARTAALLNELSAEADRSLAAFTAQDRSIRKRLGEYWSRNVAVVSPHIQKLLEKNDLIHAMGRFDRFQSDVAEDPGQYVFPSSKDDTSAEERTKKRLHAIRHWILCAMGDESDNAAHRPALASLENERGEFELEFDRACATLRRDALTLPGVALQRLRSFSRQLANEPPATTDAATLLHWQLFRQNNELLQALLAGDARFSTLCNHEQVVGDARSVFHEVRMRVAIGLSRASLVARYAARAEGFDARELNALCASDSANAERTLTLHMARFLFDQGLNPVIDPTIGQLRPDIVDVGPNALFYAEAKQYADESPRSKIRAAYSQVWSTWSRLEKRHTLHEAFVVVFRRSGPFVHLPPVVSFDGHTLYSFVADLSSESGSQEKSKTVALTEEDLLPKRSD